MTSTARRIFVAALLGLAMLAGPAAAVCAGCCPSAEGPSALASAEGCCGDCSESLAPVPAPSPVALRAAPTSPEAPAISPQPPVAPAPLANVAASVSARVRPDVPHPPTLSPLRL